MMPKRKLKNEKTVSERTLGRDYVIPVSDDFGADARTKHGDDDVIRGGESKPLKFSAGRELRDSRELFTEQVSRVMKTNNTQYIAPYGRKKGSGHRDSPDQLSLFPEQEAEHRVDSVPTQAASAADDVSVKTELRAVPAAWSSDRTLLAAMYGVRVIETPMLAALSVADPHVVVDMRQAEREAKLLQFPHADPAHVERLAGKHANGTYDLYGRNLQRYARYAGERGEPGLPLNPYLVSQLLLSRAESGTHFESLVRERDYFSATMTGMLGLASCMSDRFVRETMTMIGFEFGRHHDGRRTALLPKHLRAALPALESLAEREPGRALMYRAVMTAGLALMSRRAELTAINVSDACKTRNGYRVRIVKTKTRRLIEPPSFISLSRIHDTRICPVRALDDLMAQYGACDGPLFRKILSDGSIGESRIRPETIADIVRVVAQMAGAEGRFAAHSLRVGGINAAHQGGASAREIMSTSLHESEKSVYDYIVPALSERALTAAVFA